MANLDMAKVRMVKVVQRLYRRPLEDVGRAVEGALRRLGLHRKVAGRRIAITAGSRNIDRIAEVIREAVRFIRSHGGRPFILPAMGSHGGATPGGQVKVLEALGITEELVGAPILSTMEVEKIGEVDGTPVFVDKYALEAEGILVVNRVKHHPSIYRGLGSGLMKMLAVGMGNRKGAEVAHMEGVRRMVFVVPLMARKILQSLPVLGCLALLEDACGNLSRVVPVPPGEVEEADRMLLRLWHRIRPRLPFPEIDLLIVERMGKDIVGPGMDPRIIGRMGIAGEPDPQNPKVRTVVVLDLTEKSQGNANGIGMASVITRRLFEKVDWRATFVNNSTTGFVDRFKLPPVMPDDRTAISFALEFVKGRRPEDLRVVRIKDTSHLECFYISEALCPLARAKRGLRIVGQPHPLRFDDEGNLLPPSPEH